MMDFPQLQRDFIERYGASDAPIQQFFAPGRVNLLGDHTDYNGGLVFPCAIDFGTALLIRRRSDRLVKLSSKNFSLVAFLSPQEAMQKYADHWINYPLGVIDQFRRRGVAIEGVELLFCGDIPNGAGLSSSASLEVVTTFAFNALFNTQLNAEEMVRLALAAENEFVGVQCGIMDQYASAMGTCGHAMKLDCTNLHCEQVPLALGDYSFVIANSNQRRELTESGYNERYRQCQSALALLQEKMPVDCLASVELNQLLAEREALGDVLFRRARHVLTEHRRVEQAVDCLKRHDLQGFGALMNASHDSMRDDYETSTPMIDALVSAAVAQDGVLGSRLTGGGFGGCTVSLIETQQLSAFCQRVGARYTQETGLSADFYPVNVAQGVREVAL